MTYGKIVVRKVSVTNMGTGPVQVIFQKKTPDDETCDICAPWLIVRPLKATISPSECEARLRRVLLVYWGGSWG